MSEKQPKLEVSSPLLWNEEPIVLCRDLIKHVGLLESILLQETYYFLVDNVYTVYEDGRYWVNNTEKEWIDSLSFLCDKTLSETLETLVKEELFIEKIPAWGTSEGIKLYTINFDHPMLQPWLRERSL